RLTGRTGFHGSSFVHPTETFGELAGKLLHEGTADVDPALGLCAGDLKSWAGLKEVFCCSDYLLFGASVSAGSVLLGLLNNEEGAIFHLHGTQAENSKGMGKTKSSSGKTMTARL